MIKFVRFFGVGVISTIADWLMFASSNKLLGWPYWLALIISLTTGAIINFTLNKKLTFENESKNVFQPIVFFSIAGVMLAVSFGLMTLFVSVMDSLFARVITTFIVFILNFLLHKTITFGRLFK